MKTLLHSTLISLLLTGAFAQELDPNDASFAGCVQPRGDHSTTEKDGFSPGLYVTTANIPGATYSRDGSRLENRKIVCAHQDRRTSGGSVVIPWAQFDKGNGDYSWDFVEQEMKPWIDRGQKVNLMVWPAVQKKTQLFPDGASATPEDILADDLTFQCPDGSAQGASSEGIPLPMFWERSIYRRYTRALKAFVKQYQNNPHVNYFRLGLGVGAESYPANGATTPTNWCMDAFIDVFEGDTKEERAINAYETWKNYVSNQIIAYRKFNSKKPIVVTINDFYTLPSIDKDEFPNMIAREATRYLTHKNKELPKLGLGVQGATTAGFDANSNGQRPYAQWYNIFVQVCPGKRAFTLLFVLCCLYSVLKISRSLQHKDSGIPLQLQTPLHSGVNGRPGPWQSAEPCQTLRKNNGTYGCTNTGNMVELVNHALSVGVNSFELYPYEWVSIRLFIAFRTCCLIFIRLHY